MNGKRETNLTRNRNEKLQNMGSSQGAVQRRINRDEYKFNNSQHQHHPKIEFSALE